jgi:hypothetical protein
MQALQIRSTAADLVDQARGRIERQTRYATALARGGARSAALRALLDRACLGVRDLSRLMDLRIPLEAETDGDDILIGGSLALRNPALARDLRREGRLTAGLASLGYDQELAFAWAEGDYALHHVQTDLARETLFALQRASDRACRARHPGWRLVCVPVQAEAACGERRLWDPAAVQSLLALFPAQDCPVTLTETGFFRPLHSVLRLILLIPPQGRS